MDNLLQHSASTAAPVVVELRPYSKRQQLFRELTNDRELLLKNRLEVRHLMTRNPLVVSPTTTLEEMTSLMRERQLRHLLVCGRGGELLGVISDRDLRPQRGSTAQQLMSFPPMTCTSDTPLGAAITFLLSKNISCLPVVDNGDLCGIITTTDLTVMLQCSLQLWLRLAQVLQHDPTWSEQLESIEASLDGDLSTAQLTERIHTARQAINQEIQSLINAIDLRADALTGMGNRRELEEVLDLLLAVKKRHQRPFSLAIVIVDHYQRINETCGEAVVKPLLKAVGQLIEQSVRESDFVARYRDDAFAIILTETNQQQASVFCRRLCEAAQRNSQLDIKPRISVGAAEADASEDLAQLLARAEAAVG